ncbi:three-helix bundle dimerization domain-containing protein [Streptomyces broussonetiae]|uniref:three-helix bundle dimerization domain-containing protein n=1 Tax=Streptomyces broussonetiae TaxID=2686304 RepID=UPI00131A6A07
MDLHLTTRVIQRFSEDLRETTAVRHVPGSRWVTVHLDCDGDVVLLMSLVSTALQAHQAVCPFVDAPPAVCNFRRVTVVDRDNEAVVACAYAAFRDRPVRDFVPILVEPRARRILDGASE